MAKPEKLFGRQISKVAEQAEQELGAKADPVKLAERAAAIGKETFGVSHDFTADYFTKRREKAGQASEPPREEAQVTAAVTKRPGRPPRAAENGHGGAERHQPASRGGDVTLAELRALRTRLNDDKTDVAALADLLPKVEEYVRLAGGLERLRQAVEFLGEKE